MKLLVLDSRPDEYHYAPGLDGKILGHNLGLKPNWPIEVFARWNDFERRLKEPGNEFGALLIHTSDALAMTKTASSHQEIASAMRQYGAGKPIIFFSGAGLSGDPLLFEQAMQGYSGNARACSVAEVRRLIREFGANDKGDCSVFEIFPAEVALQGLNALLPIGLLWEIHESKAKAAEVVGHSDQTGMSEFERRLQNYSSEMIIKNQTPNADPGLVDPERPEYRILWQWFDKLSRGKPEKVWNGIDLLLACDNVEAWNDTLTKLRDKWLEAAE